MTKSVLVALIIASSVRLANATELSTNYVNQIVSAIYRTEGGTKTKYPFGIHWETNYAKAKRIAENTVRNNHRRWKASGSSEDYISFLSKRYCPYNSEVWRKNVNKFLSEKR